MCPNWVLFHSFRSGDLEVFRLDGIEGSSGTQPINLTKASSMDSRPSRSADGQWVVFQSDRNGNVELYLTDSEGKAQTRLTNTKSNNINAMIGPDNKTIVYQSDRNGNWDVYMLDKDTLKETQLTSSAGDNVNPFWSPDSNWITYQSNRSGSWNIYIFDIAKATNQAAAAGARLYWDNTAKQLTTTSSGNLEVGVAIDASGTTDTTARIKLGQVPATPIA